MLKRVSLWALLILSCCLLLHNQLIFQGIIATGDHGRDLYAFAATMDGEMPYKDYYWVYGPLAPYYYSIFFKLFGVHISSILLGRFLLNLIAGFFVFAILSIFISPLFSYIGALWFWGFMPICSWTYNHTVGIMFLMSISYWMIKYLDNKNIKFAYLSLLTAFFLSLVKINFGIIALAALILYTYLSDRIGRVPASKEKMCFYLACIVGAPLIIIAVYWYFLNSLPLYTIRECLPYLSSYRPYQVPFLAIIGKWLGLIAYSIHSNWLMGAFAALAAFSTLQTLRNLKTSKFDGINKEKIICTVLLLASFYLLSMHEYFLSGVMGRTYWAKPFSILLAFLFIGLNAKHSSKIIRALFVIILFTAICGKFKDETRYVQSLRNLNKNLGLNRAHILISNPNAWINNVRQTTAFLKRNLSKEESFFALPYDSIYYYLTDKKSPTQQIALFDWNNIPEDQEREIIEKLEVKNINWIVVSNRAHSKEKGMGTFGKSYCPLLGQYLKDNFGPAATFGNWNDPGDWAHSHSVRIFKRKL